MLFTGSEEEFREAIVEAAAGNEFPVLKASQLSLCLGGTARVDADGNKPGSDAYTPTWDLTLAVRRAFRFRAGNCAGQHDFSENGQSFSASQMRTALMAQSREWTSGVVSVRVAGPTTDRGDRDLSDLPLA